METKYNVGDKIEITKYDGEIFKTGDILKIKKLDSSECCYVDSDYGTLNIGKCNGDICFKIYEKPRLHNVQPGDLLWNDELGICKIDDINCCENYPISIISDNSSDVITLDGKRFVDSPKATFFYYSPENHYLTERPEPEVDWSKVPGGTKVKVNDIEKDLEDDYIEIFMGYFPDLEKPFWIFDDSDKDTSTGYKFGELAEPCNPEWRK